MIRASRVRPAGNFEATAWFFMRVSGVILILIALFHMLWMHFVVSVETITFATIVERWTGPQGAFWRIFDLMLLVFAFTHGINGMRQVIDDYIESRGWNAFLQTSIWIVWALLLGMGAWIIFTFQPNMPTPFK